MKHFDTDTFPLIKKKTTVDASTFFFQREERADLCDVGSSTLLKDSKFLSIKLTMFFLLCIVPVLSVSSDC